VRGDAYISDVAEHLDSKKVLVNLMLLPGAPRRLLDDLGEMKALMRDLLQTEEELTRTKIVPEMGKGPLEKAKQALTGE
jgi:hypothetical protein